MMAKRCSSLIVAAIALWLAVPAPAGAHGGLEGSDPAADARVKRPPGRVTMGFSEFPSEDSVMKVLDGCKRDVVSSTSVAGSDLVGVIGSGQPGKWKASYRVISAEDGHLTKGSFSFTVTGKKDCNPDDDKKDGGDGSATAAPPEDPNGASGAGDDDSSVPVVPIALGATGLVVIGLVVRRVSGG
jgi:methionine-rich copper-binding protein CopC